MYNDQSVYKVVIWAFFGISLRTEKVVLIREGLVQAWERLSWAPIDHLLQNILYAAICQLARNMPARKGNLLLAIICASWIFQLGSFPILTQLDICTPK